MVALRRPRIGRGAPPGRRDPAKGQGENSGGESSTASLLIRRVASPLSAKGHPRRSSQQGPRRSRGVRRSSLQRPNAPTCWGQGGAGFRCSVLDGLAPATDRAAPAEQAGRLAQRRGMRSFGIGRSIDAPRLPAYFVPGVVMIICDALPANGTGWHAGSGAPAGDTSWGLPEYPRLDFCAASRDSAAAACRQSSKNSTF